MKNSTANILKGIVFVFLLIVTIKLLEHYFNLNIVLGVLFGLFLFSLLARKIAWFKPYFISQYNFLTSKAQYQQEFDFSKDLLFEKLIEVMQAAGFKIVQTDAHKGNIFATASITWVSWGENIYISMEEVNGKTTVDFCSACFFQIYSWGKNERNYENFLQEFEASLTI